MITEMRFERAERGDQNAGGRFLADPPPAPALALRPFLQRLLLQTGEAVSSRLFAQLLSAHFDWLITVDPHLHRYHNLAEIYSIPTAVVHAAPLLADWICTGGLSDTVFKRR